MYQMNEEIKSLQTTIKEASKSINFFFWPFKYLDTRPEPTDYVIIGTLSVIDMLKVLKRFEALILKG